MNDSVRAANSGSRKPDPSFTGSGPAGFDPGCLVALIERIERGENTPALVDAIHELAPLPKVIQPSNYLRSFDAALGLVPGEADWRRFTNRSCSIYAASPYNAKAEVRHDGYGPTAAAQLCAAVFKMHLAKAKQRSQHNGN